jgi:L-ribulokinase
MLMVMGTSTCHIMNGRSAAEVTGMCGTVDGGVIAGAWGFEAGQTGVGDIFAWYVDHNLPPAYHDAARERGVSVHTLLAEEAAKQPVGGHGLVALDWHNGNRSILVDHELSGVLVGATLATRPPEIYRALIEATAFGTRRIIDAFEDAGVPVTELVIAGGLLKNPFLMQIYADVTRRSLSLIGSAQGPALGSAIHAAVAAGAYPDVPTAAKAMGKVERDVYRPDPERAEAYEPLYAAYRELHDYFGQSTKDSLLHRLRRIRNEARGQS